MKKSLTILIFFLILGILHQLTGCASIYSRTGKTEPEWTATGKIYPGVQGDIVLAGAMMMCIVAPIRDTAVQYIMLPFAVADMPLSFVVDTICLPYDLTKIGHTSETIWYGASTYWVIKRNGQGQLDGKMTFQLDTDDGTIWGATRYRNNLAHGMATARGEPLGDEKLKGEYINGKCWNGSFLVHTGSPAEPIAGPVEYYKEGRLTGSSNKLFHIRKIILKSWRNPPANTPNS